jgi:hypothetical protein
MTTLRNTICLLLNPHAGALLVNPLYVAVKHRGHVVPVLADCIQTHTLPRALSAFPVLDSLHPLALPQVQAIHCLHANPCTCLHPSGSNNYCQTTQEHQPQHVCTGASRGRRPPACWTYATTGIVERANQQEKVDFGHQSVGATEYVRRYYDLQDARAKVQCPAIPAKCCHV